MKPSLQLKLGQQLTMTPQLQQAIRLLQLSTLELQQEIQEALETNPLLEQDENTEDENTQDFDIDDRVQPDAQSKEALDVSEEMSQQEMPEDLPLDSSWEDIYSTSSGSAGLPQGEDIPVYQGETTETLHDYLNWQLQLTPFSDLDLAIATAIIDAVDDKEIGRAHV